MLLLDITSLPASVAPGSDATLAARTSAGAACQAKAKYHSGKLSLAAGLAKKQTADTAGKVSWTWTVELGTKPGTATATVACKLKGSSVTKSKAFIVIG